MAYSIPTSNPLASVPTSPFVVVLPKYTVTQEPKGLGLS